MEKFLLAAALVVLDPYFISSIKNITQGQIVKAEDSELLIQKSPSWFGISLFGNRIKESKTVSLNEVMISKDDLSSDDHENIRILTNS